ncbi:MAG: hypothetical protein H0W25_01485 [Acidimicrobiia bacterium]|nr:hypothetical protein [Acidimicrobiia bacterium]
MTRAITCWGSPAATSASKRAAACPRNVVTSAPARRMTTSPDFRTS